MKFWLLLFVHITYLYCQRVDGALSGYLWNQTSQLHPAALESSFIQGIAKVSLNPSAFGGYMVQDSVYCYKVKENLDIAAERANDPTLKQFLKDRSKSYQSYYESLYKVWHIRNDTGINLGCACADYLNHIHNVATSMDPYYMVVALIPCAKLWPWLGQQIGAKIKTFGLYTEWIEENLDPEYTGYEKYDNLIDDAMSNGKIDQKIALQVYLRSMMGEVAFFSSV